MIHRSFLDIDFSWFPILLTVHQYSFDPVLPTRNKPVWFNPTSTSNSRLTKPESTIKQHQKKKKSHSSPNQKPHENHRTSLTPYRAVVPTAVTGKLFPHSKGTVFDAIFNYYSTIVALHFVISRSFFLFC